jgi:hypothetical protein
VGERWRNYELTVVVEHGDLDEPYAHEGRYEEFMDRVIELADEMLGHPPVISARFVAVEDGEEVPTGLD